MISKAKERVLWEGGGVLRGLCVEVFARSRVKSLVRNGEGVRSGQPLVILIADEFLDVLLMFFSFGSKSVV